jgi:hypothetical protein
MVFRQADHYLCNIRGVKLRRSERVDDLMPEREFDRADTRT